MSPDGNGLSVKVNKAGNGSAVNTTFTWDPKRFTNDTDFIDIQIVVFDLTTITKPIVKNIIKIGNKIKNIGKWVWSYAEEEATKPSLPFCHFDPTELYIQIAFEAVEFGWDEYSHKDYRSHWLANAGIEASQFIGDFCDDWVREAECDSCVNGGHSEESHPNNPFRHYIDDILPWIMCCYKQSEEICAKYQTKRPCDRGTNYTPPAPARGTGDPHLNTFDGYFYTFNGYGEFWILQNTSSQPLAVQARMEPLNSTSNEATIFSGFVFAAPNSSIIQIQKSQIRIVDIYIDGQQLEITSPNFLKRLSMDGWQMSIADDLSSIHIGFSIGFAFEITTISGAFGFSASASPDWKGKTLGLLGTFNDNQSDDLTSKTGTIIPINSTLQQIHEQFGITWITTAQTTLFKYFNEKTFDDYNHID
uniref:VWFD domain-containing protein n=1 Tax=Panagrolaimus davidi TaxID=227884 RepID=A0A914PFX9_9BILA